MFRNCHEFNKAFDRIFINEGGFQANPCDRGNWTTGRPGQGECKGTKFGISAMSYPELDIARLTRDEAKRIYWVDWWNTLDLHQYTAGMRYQLFDAAINHGMRNAIRILQWAVVVKADGIVGPVTRDALSKTSADDLLMLFISERLVFMTDLRGWENFGRGWARRIAHNLKYASVDNEE